MTRYSRASGLTVHFGTPEEIHTCYKQQQALDGCYIEPITYERDVLPYMTGPTYAVDYSYSGEDCGVLPED